MANEKSELEQFLEEVHKDARISRIQATIEDINTRLNRIEKRRQCEEQGIGFWPSLNCEREKL